MLNETIGLNIDASKADLAALTLAEKKLRGMQTAITALNRQTMVLLANMGRLGNVKGFDVREINEATTSMRTAVPVIGAVTSSIAQQGAVAEKTTQELREMINGLNKMKADARDFGKIETIGIDKQETAIASVMRAADGLSVSLTKVKDGQIDVERITENLGKKQRAASRLQEIQAKAEIAAYHEVAQRKIQAQEKLQKAGEMHAQAHLENKKREISADQGIARHYERIRKAEVDAYQEAAQMATKAANQRSKARQQENMSIARHDKALAGLNRRAAEYGEIVKKGSLAGQKYSVQVQDASGRIRTLTYELGKGQKGHFQLARSAEKAESAIRRLEEANRSVGTAIVHATGKVAQWAVATGLIYGTIRAFKVMFASITDVDREMAGLTKVYRYNRAELGPLKQDLMELAQVQGASVGKVIEAGTRWAKLGYDRIEIAKLTKVALIAQTVAEIEVGEATDYLTAALITFNKRASDAIGVLDSWNQLSNNFAVTTQDLGESMRWAGSTFAQVGVQIETLNAYTTALVQATKASGNEIGQALKTLGAYIYRVGTMNKIQQVAGISIRQGSKDLMELDDVITALARKWGELSEQEQNQIAETIGGARRRREFLLLMKEFPTVIQAEIHGFDSVGSAMKENEIIMGTVSKKAEQLKGSLEVLAETVGDAGLRTAIIKSIDTLDNLVTGLVELRDAIALVSVAITASVLYTLGKYLIPISAGISRLNLVIGGTVLLLGIAATVIGKAANAQKKLRFETDESIRVHQAEINTLKSKIEGINTLVIAFTSLAKIKGQDAEQNKQLQKYGEAIASILGEEAVIRDKNNQIIELATIKIEENTTAMRANMDLKEDAHEKEIAAAITKEKEIIASNERIIKNIKEGLKKISTKEGTFNWSWVVEKVEFDKLTKKLTKAEDAVRNAEISLAGLEKQAVSTATFGVNPLTDEIDEATESVGAITKEFQLLIDKMSELFRHKGAMFVSDSAIAKSIQQRDLLREEFKERAKLNRQSELTAKWQDIDTLSPQERVAHAEKAYQVHVKHFASMGKLGEMEQQRLHQLREQVIELKELVTHGEGLVLSGKDREENEERISELLRKISKDGEAYNQIIESTNTIYRKYLVDLEKAGVVQKKAKDQQEDQLALDLMRAEGADEITVSIKEQELAQKRLDAVQADLVKAEAVLAKYGVSKLRNAEDACKLAEELAAHVVNGTMSLAQSEAITKAINDQLELSSEKSKINLDIEKLVAGQKIKGLAQTIKAMEESDRAIDKLIEGANQLQEAESKIMDERRQQQELFAEEMRFIEMRRGGATEEAVRVEKMRAAQENIKKIIQEINKLKESKPLIGERPAPEDTDLIAMYMKDLEAVAAIDEKILALQAKESEQLQQINDLTKERANILLETESAIRESLKQAKDDYDQKLKAGREDAQQTIAQHKRVLGYSLDEMRDMNEMALLQKKHNDLLADEVKYEAELAAARATQLKLEQDKEDAKKRLLKLSQEDKIDTEEQSKIAAIMEQANAALEIQSALVEKITKQYLEAGMNAGILGAEIEAMPEKIRAKIEGEWKQMFNRMAEGFESQLVGGFDNLAESVGQWVDQVRAVQDEIKQKEIEMQELREEGGIANEVQIERLQNEIRVLQKEASVFIRLMRGVGDVVSDIGTTIRKELIGQMVKKWALPKLLAEGTLKISGQDEIVEATQQGGETFKQSIIEGSRIGSGYYSFMETTSITGNRAKERMLAMAKGTTATARPNALNTFNIAPITVDIEPLTAGLGNFSDRLGQELSQASKDLMKTSTKTSLTAGGSKYSLPVSAGMVGYSMGGKGTARKTGSTLGAIGASALAGASVMAGPFAPLVMMGGALIGDFLGGFFDNSEKEIKEAERRQKQLDASAKKVNLPSIYTQIFEEQNRYLEHNDAYYKQLRLLNQKELASKQTYVNELRMLGADADVIQNAELNVIQEKNEAIAETLVQMETKLGDIAYWEAMGRAEADTKEERYALRKRVYDESLQAILLAGGTARLLRDLETSLYAEKKELYGYAGVGTEHMGEGRYTASTSTSVVIYQTNEFRLHAFDVQAVGDAPMRAFANKITRYQQEAGARG